MTVEHVEILVEEPSMEAALRELLPKLLGQVTFHIYTYQGKSDLLKQLLPRLRGYKAFLPPSWKVVILVDRDDDDCHELKQELELAAAHAGLPTRSSVIRGTDYAVVTRIAIEELEAWYFGDWVAVRSAYPKMNINIPSKATYRSPDHIAGGTWEAFERVARHAGYFRGGLRKVEAAREIGAKMSIDSNSSPSFIKFCTALKELVDLT